jgi:hypothetical protein
LVYWIFGSPFGAIVWIELLRLGFFTRGQVTESEITLMALPAAFATRWPARRGGTTIRDLIC